MALKYLINSIQFNYINKCKNAVITNIGAKVVLKHVRLLETNTKSQKVRNYNCEMW